MEIHILGGEKFFVEDVFDFVRGIGEQSEGADRAWGDSEIVHESVVAAEAELADIENATECLEVDLFECGDGD